MGESARTKVASLDRIRAQHFDLKQRATRLHDAFGGVAPAARERAQLGDQLAGFEAALNAHFALEEEGGYMAEVLAAAPRLSNRATRLEGAHEGFRRQLAELRQRTTNPNSPWEDLRARFQRLFADLQAHDAAEDELVHEAFEQDLGG